MKYRFFKDLSVILMIVLIAAIYTGCGKEEKASRGSSPSNTPSSETPTSTVNLEPTSTPTLDPFKVLTPEPDITSTPEPTETPTPVEKDTKDTYYFGEVKYPQSDNKYLQMIKDAGLLVQDSYEGTVILLNDKVDTIEVLFAGKGPGERSYTFGFKEDSDSNEAEKAEFLSAYNVCYNDYKIKVESGDMTYVDFNGDGVIQNTELQLIALFLMKVTISGDVYIVIH